MSRMNRIEMTEAEWKKEGERLFGSDVMTWQFVCPSCGHVACVADWQRAGAPDGTVGFSCIGRWTGDPQKAKEAFLKNAGGPCNYAGGGLFGLNPVRVKGADGIVTDVFAFAGSVVAGACTPETQATGGA